MSPQAVDLSSAGVGGSVHPGAEDSGTELGSPGEGLASSSTIFFTSSEGSGAWVSLVRLPCS